MKHKRQRLGIILCLVSLLVLQPVWAEEHNEVKSDRVFKLHWAAKYVADIEGKLYIQPSNENHPFDKPITLDRLKELTELALGKAYPMTLKGVTREEVVNQMVLIWSQITGQNPADMHQPMVLLYRDEGEIHPQLLWNIRHANFIGLAKGRDNGYFSPKDPITHGEAATLLSRLKELKMSYERVEATFKTTATYEKLEDGIHFNIQFTNLKQVPVPVTFGSGQQFELTILDQSGKEVYRYSDGYGFITMIIEEVLGPGESFTWQDTWDYRDKDGALLTQGTYTAVIQVLAKTEEKRDPEEFREELTFTINLNDFVAATNN